jgi:hypothetical protein
LHYRNTKKCSLPEARTRPPGTCLSRRGIFNAAEQGYVRQLGLTQSSALSISISTNTISIVFIQNLILFNRRPSLSIQLFLMGIHIFNCHKKQLLEINSKNEVVDAVQIMQK